VAPGGPRRFVLGPVRDNVGRGVLRIRLERFREFVSVVYRESSLTSSRSPAAAARSRFVYAARHFFSTRVFEHLGRFVPGRLLLFSGALSFSPHPF
jgi:hypothetical protein